MIGNDATGGLNRRNLLKLVGSGLAVSAAGLTAGCGPRDNTPDSPGPSVDPNKKVTLPEPTAGKFYPEPYSGPKAYALKPFNDGSKTFKVVVRQDPTTTGDWATNAFSKWFEQRTGVKIEYVAVNTTGADGSTDLSKITAMLAGGELPDAFLGIPLSQGQISLYGEQGLFVDLTQLVDVYAPQQTAMLAAMPSLKRNVTSLDGKRYQMSGVNECFHCNTAMSKAFINTEYLDKIGAKMPETLDDFRNVLKEFKARNPSGKDGFLPFIGTNPGLGDGLDVWFVNPFTYNPGEPWLRRNGDKVEFVPTLPEYRQGLAYMRTLYDDGTLTKQAFSLTYDELGKLGNQGLIGVARSFYWGAFVGIEYTPDALWKKYAPIMPLKGPSGKGIASNNYNIRPQISLLITKNCTNPEVLVQWGDYQLELEATLRAYDRGGDEGKQWEFAKQGTKGIDERQAVYNILPGPSGEKDVVGRGWNQLSLMNRTLDYRNGQQVDANNPNFEGDLYRVSKQYEAYWQPKEQQLPTLLFDQDNAATVADMAATIKNHVQGSFAKFATAGLDINDDKAWNDYVATFDKMGLKKYLEMYQAAYDKAPK